MSFHRYLKEQRGHFIDHRTAVPPSPGVPIDDEQAPPGVTAGGAGAGGGSMLRRVARRGRSDRNGSGDAAAGGRYRHVKPAFTPSAWSDPLPYEEPWERAFR